MALKNGSKVFDAQKDYCAYCEVDLLASLSAFWSVQRDHVHARAAGGNDERENMVICCPVCNQALSRAKHLRSFMERREYIRKLYAKQTPT